MKFLYLISLLTIANALKLGTPGVKPVTKFNYQGGTNGKITVLFSSFSRNYNIEKIT